MSNQFCDDDGFGVQELDVNLDVSRETIERIKIVVQELDRWRVTHNLIGPEERKRLWRRHILDSLQLIKYRRKGGESWLDLGSGAGFPALILACATKEEGDAFTLVESNGKKASFLRSAIRAADLNARVVNQRIEDVSRETYQHVTARALADLPRLLDHAYLFLAPEASCIFLKGKGFRDELEAANRVWRFEFEEFPSLSHPDGRIIVISELRRRMQ